MPHRGAEHVAVTATAATNVYTDFGVLGRPKTE